jgi:hypothetical protein
MTTLRTLLTPLLTPCVLSPPNTPIGSGQYPLTGRQAACLLPFRGWCCSDSMDP